MSLKIAVADDEADMRDYLERLLPRLGHQVIAVAEDGAELVELCRVNKPDLVITDLRMPNMDGQDAIAELTRDNHIPVIAVSAHLGEDDFVPDLPRDSWLFLHKPVKSADLEAAIERLFGPDAATREVALGHDASGNIEKHRAAPLVPQRNSVAGRPLQLLLVDDDEEFLANVTQYLKRCGHEVQAAADAETALRCVGQSAFDVAVLDLRLPQMSGLELLEKLRHSNEDCQAIMLTGMGTVETAVQAMKLGAFDYLTKPVKLAELHETIQRAWDRSSVMRENLQLRAALKHHQRPRKMIGDSPVMDEVYRLIQRAGPTDKPVLILGESGTGKELVADALHDASPLADRPLVVVNCAALPETLLESELFGHEKGAFTGAVSAKPGLFEVADGGTLFIDEIGELAAGLQAKLLRVLEDGSMRRIGSVKERKVNVRLIAATNRNLHVEVESNRFREDLYYRINLLTIHLPPLRDRASDLPLLVQHFADDWDLHETLLPTLQRYSWPGNVRQLRNAIERMKILAETSQLHPNDLPPEVLSFSDQVSARTAPIASGDLETLTRKHVIDTYERCDHNKARTAKALGIGRRSLYRLLEKYGIHETGG